jgi:hypothetical protein
VLSAPLNRGSVVSRAVSRGVRAGAGAGAAWCCR